ncbi:MAG: adenylate/guanylate cyclase domain-containing protein [Myxococcales bacterium]|nr:adenylate/guanylate cyclase domain-containing protein [Myxococcales bacterium]
MGLDNFYALLDRYNAAPAGPDADAVEAELWERWGQERAVLVLDMSGFSRVVRRWGIVHYLSMVRRMHTVTEPLVHQHCGEVVKFEADNLYAAFAQCRDALRAARAIRTGFDAMNALTPYDKDIHVSIGIAWGRILLCDGQDYFGDAVNVACKLGEDMAQRDEVLISAEALARVPQDERDGLREVQFTISGLDLTAWLLPAPET